MGTKKPATPEWARWLKARGYSLAPLTGTDYKALDAIAQLWHLFVYTRDENLLVAIGYAARHMQQSTLFFARELAAHAGNWEDRDVWWPHVERARRLVALISEERSRFPNPVLDALRRGDS